MTKRLITLTMALLLLTGVSMQAQEKFTQFNVGKPIIVRSPIMNDSINPKGKKHTAKALLQTPTTRIGGEATMTIQQADTAGYIHFAKATKDNYLYQINTQLRAERFVKGKLKVSSPVRFELFVNGKSKLIKEVAEDSLSKAGSKEIELRLEPEMDYEIMIKLLATSNDKTAPALKCEWVKNATFKDAAYTYSMLPNQKKRFALSNTVYGSRTIAVAISPDGKYLLTRFWNNYPTKRSRTYNELMELKTGKVILSNLRDGMKWMPKSNKLYYTVQAETGNDIITLDPTTLQEEVLLEGVPEESFTWSPNEDYLIYYPKEEGSKEEGPLKRIIDPSDRIPNTRGRSFLALYNISNGVSERLTFGNHSTYLRDISPDDARYSD